MHTLPVQNLNEFRGVLSNLNTITIDLLLFELQEYNDILFDPRLYVYSREFDNYYDFEKLGSVFLNDQFSLNTLSEKVVYKRQSDNEVYGFVFCECAPTRAFKIKDLNYGNILGVIYMKE